MAWKINFTQGDDDPDFVGFAEAVYSFEDDGKTPDFTYRTPAPANGRINIEREKDAFALMAQVALDNNLGRVKTVTPYVVAAEAALKVNADKSTVLSAKLAEITSGKVGV